MPGDYEVTGRSALYAAGSLSNFCFFKHTGYFDSASDMMPLLHIWSLGIEEQFYLLWPALLVFIAAIVGSSRHKVGFVVAVLCLTNLALCLYWMHIDPKVVFYLPQARAWELGVGALLAIVPRSRYPASLAVAATAGLAGLSLILWSAFSLTSASPFPGQRNRSRRRGGPSDRPLESHRAGPKSTFLRALHLSG
jgi:peptidoglycan/LPS O-acetylase OafA/YrhL